MARAAAVVGVVGLAPGALASCGGRSDQGGVLGRARRDGEMRVGLAGEVPYGYIQDGQATGEAPSVAKAVLAELGVSRLVPVEVRFDELISGLLQKQYDMIAAGMNITPDRCQQVAFSDPDYTAPTALLVRKGNPTGVTDFEDIRNKDLRVAVLSGAVEGEEAKDAGILDDHIRVYGALDEMLAALLANRVECAALTNISLNALLKTHQDADVEVTKGFFPVSKGKQVVTAGGFVFRREDDDLRQRFNARLAEMHSDGRWVRIVEPFGFNADNLPGKGVTGCS
jgi:polar amino acid transport system substrate-binding protein